MKAFAVAILLCCLSAVLAGGDFTEEQKKLYHESKDACAAESGVDLADIKKMKETGEFTEDQNIKDFLFCLFKKLGFMNDDGEYQTEMIEAALTIKKDEETAKKIVEACTKETHGSGPETAFQMAKCYHEHAH